MVLVSSRSRLCNCPATAVRGLAPPSKLSSSDEVGGKNEVFKREVGGGVFKEKSDLFRLGDLCKLPGNVGSCMMIAGRKDDVWRLEGQICVCQPGVDTADRQQCQVYCRNLIILLAVSV